MSKTLCNTRFSCFQVGQMRQGSNSKLWETVQQRSSARQLGWHVKNISVRRLTKFNWGGCRISSLTRLPSTFQSHFASCLFLAVMDKWKKCLSEADSLLTSDWAMLSDQDVQTWAQTQGSSRTHNWNLLQRTGRYPMWDSASSSATLSWRFFNLSCPLIESYLKSLHYQHFLSHRFYSNVLLRTSQNIYSWPSDSRSDHPTPQNKKYELMS